MICFEQIQKKGGPDEVRWNMGKSKSGRILLLETVSGYMEKETRNIIYLLISKATGSDLKAVSGAIPGDPAGKNRGGWEKIKNFHSQNTDDDG